jgi:hypothetical protein
VGISNLGPIIKTAINTYGPTITKTEVSLDDVQVSLFSGEAKLENFVLGNPEGFTSPQAMKVNSILVNVNEKTLAKNTIIIDSIEIVSPVITYEKKRRSDNFKAILNNVNGAVKEDKPQKVQAEKKEAGKKILIRSFVLKDGKVNLVMPGLRGKRVTARLPDIRLKNVGEEKGGASPAEAAQEIVAALYERIASPSVAGSLNKGLGTLGSTLEAAKDGAQRELGGVTDKVKGLFGK